MQLNMGPKTAVIYTTTAENRILITLVWNRAMNFGSGSVYPVPATDLFITLIRQMAALVRRA